MKKIRNQQTGLFFIPLTFVILICMLIVSGCGVYSFTGASIPPGAKTISINYFQNNALLVQPTLSQRLTDALRDKFTGETSLHLVTENGDMSIEGEITGYMANPIAIQGNETAALNRLTITVKVRFVSQLDEKMNYETSFTRYQDYDSSSSLADVEDELIDQINQQLVQDIFDKAVVNW
ncbi:MAG TPA: LptE family protein [Bacteroidales bacterium]|nr:LptE family protein [Bacteroidales bacterium]HNS45876.1 LptE family protein [Bacteroidales bacterium]